MRTIVLLLLCFFKANTNAQTTPKRGNNYAVFFYVTDFDHKGWQPLPETRVETNAIKKELETNFGFKCESVPNPTKKKIISKLSEYNEKVKSNDQVLYFFSTHGYYDKKSDRGYLIGRDGSDEDLYGESWLSYDDLKGYVAHIKAKHTLLALDACHSGAFGIRYRGKPENPFLEDCNTMFENSMEYVSKQYCASGNKDAKTPAKSSFAERFLRALQEEGQKKGIVTFEALQFYLSQIRAPNPQPQCGDFGSYDQKGRFMFLRNGGCKNLVDSAAIKIIPPKQMTFQLDDSVFTKPNFIRDTKSVSVSTTMDSVTLTLSLPATLLNKKLRICLKSPDKTVEVFHVKGTGENIAYAPMHKVTWYYQKDIDPYAFDGALLLQVYVFAMDQHLPYLSTKDRLLLGGIGVAGLGCAAYGVAGIVGGKNLHKTYKSVRAEDAPEYASESREQIYDRANKKFVYGQVFTIAGAAILAGGAWWWHKKLRADPKIDPKTLCKVYPKTILEPLATTVGLGICLRF